MNKKTKATTKTEQVSVMPKEITWFDHAIFLASNDDKMAAIKQIVSGDARLTAKAKEYLNLDTPIANGFIELMELELAREDK